MGSKSLYVVVGLISLILVTSLMSFNIYLSFATSVLLLFIVPQRKYWDSMSFFIVFFSILYAIVLISEDRVDSWANTISYIICPLIFYRVGRFISDVTTTHQFLSIATIIITSYTLPLAIVTLLSISETGEIINIYRALGSDGYGDDTIGATYYGMHASLGISSMVIIFSKMKGIGIQKFLLFICALLSVLTTIHLINRSGLVIFIVCIFVSMCYSAKSSKSNVIIGVIVCAIVIALLSYVDEQSNMEMVEAYISREEDDATNLMSGGGRIATAKNVIDKMFDNPFGMPDEMYAHNLWLDIIRLVGFLPFFPFLVVTVLNIRNLWQCLRSNDLEIMPLLLGVNVGVFIMCMMEPVIEGSALYFYIIMMLWGMNTSLAIKYKANRKKK